jgi:hypothetical protein
MPALFFSNDPTYIIARGLSYCIGESFGTQLSPNPADGSPIIATTPYGYTPPYPPFPPPSNGGLSSFDMTVGNNGGTFPHYGYADSTVGGPFGALNSGGGTGGAVLNGFFVALVGGTGTLQLYITGNNASPAQNFFNAIAFNDGDGRAKNLTSAAAGYTALSNNQSLWDWTVPAQTGTWTTWTNGVSVPVTVS